MGSPSRNILLYHYPVALAVTRATSKGPKSSRRCETPGYFLGGGTGMPGIFTLTAPRWFRLVKYRVFQSSPPKARLVVAEAPCTIRPSFLPRPSMIHNPPAPPQ